MSRDRSTLSGILRRGAILFGTLAVMGLSAALVAGGARLLAVRAAEAPLTASAPAVPVAVLPVRLVDSYQVTARHVGQIAAPRRVDLGFERGGTLAWVGPDEGDAVAAGQVVARLDTRALQAERARQIAARDALVARLDLAELTEDRQARLEERGFSATQRLDEARLGAAELRARIAEVDAALQGLAVERDKAEIRAPFDATVGARAADPGATMAPGAPVLGLYEAGGAELRVGLPPDVAATLHPGAAYPFELNGQQADATFRRLRPDLDPATRTITALFDLPDTDAPVGQIGNLRLTRTLDARGAWLPLSALREGERGLWTVMRVIDTAGGPVIGQEAVEILHAEAGRAFVRGTLPDGALIVPHGAHRVTLGQRVDPLQDKG